MRPKVGVVRMVPYGQRPVNIVAAHVGVAALTAAIGFAAGLPWWLTLAAVTSFLVTGGVRAWQEWRERVQRRRAADRWLLWGAEARPASELLAWRANELASKRRRRTLARSLRGILREAEGRMMPGPVPLNRPGIRSHSDLLRAVEAQLADSSRPLAPRGALLVEQLLTEPGSPLYSWGPGDLLLAGLLDEARNALEPLEAQPRTDLSRPGAASPQLGRLAHRIDWTGRN